MRAAFGRGEIIFPEEMLPLEGFCGIHDNPHARVMYLEGAGDAMALCVMELVNVPQQEIQYTREQLAAAYALPIDKTWVHMTHAITTPHEPGPMGPPDKRPPITQRQIEQRSMFSAALRNAVDTAIAQSRKDLSAARIGWGSGTCDANQNRDVHTPYGWWIGVNGDGPSDKEMQVLKVENLDGSLKGLLVNYGLKPCAIDNSGMETGTRLISSDCCGMASTLVENDLNTVVIYTMGAAGDQVPVKTSLVELVTEDGQVVRQDEGVEAGIRYAGEVAAILAADMETIVTACECDVYEAPAQWAYISFPWELRKGRGPRQLTNHLTHEREGRLGDYTAETFRIGDAVFLANRTETVTQTWLELKAQSPFVHNVLMCMTNGEAKYLPDACSVERGTWEAQSSMYMPGCAERFVEETAVTWNRMAETAD